MLPFRFLCVLAWFFTFSGVSLAQPVSLLDTKPLQSAVFSSSRDAKTQIVRAQHGFFDSALRVTLRKTPREGVWHGDFVSRRAVAEGDTLGFRFFVRAPDGAGRAQLAVRALPDWSSPIGEPTRTIGRNWEHFALAFRVPQAREAGKMWLRFTLTTPQTVEIGGVEALNFGVSSRDAIARWQEWPVPPLSTPRGVWFQKPQLSAAKLPDWASWHAGAPRPLVGSRRDWETLYRRAWNEAFERLRAVPASSPLVSPFIVIAGDNALVQWDNAFATFYLRYSQSSLPPLGSLDNFYARQHPSGFIAREMQEDGTEILWGGPMNAANPPIFAWAEWEYFRFSGDRSRLSRVALPLEKHLEWWAQKGSPEALAHAPDWNVQGRRARDSVHTLFWNTPNGSGTQNLPREGTGWVDASSQMVLAWRSLAGICDELGQRQKAARFARKAQDLSAQINRWCWSETDGFYYDVRRDGTQFKAQTVAGFWPLVAGVATPKQAARLAAHLLDERKFWRSVPFPSIEAGHPQYKPSDSGWRGSVWPPTNYMIIKGLENYGFEELASAATNKYLHAMSETLREKNELGGVFSSELPFLRVGDYTAWAGLGPIALLIENSLGFRVNGAKNTLEWRLNRTDAHGIENLRVGRATVAAFCAPRKHARAAAKLEISTDAPLKMRVWNGKKCADFELGAGEATLEIKGE